MKLRRGADFQPFAPRGRGAMIAILATICLVSALTVIISTRTTSGARNQASVVEIAGRQRTLAERYLNDVLLTLNGDQADPAYTASLLRGSANVLLDGGAAPGVNGDDDRVVLPRATDPAIRAQLKQEARLVNDLTATGEAILAGRPVDSVDSDRGRGASALRRDLPPEDPCRARLQLSLNASRAIATAADRKVDGLITTQIAPRCRWADDLVRARDGADRRDPAPDRPLPKPRHRRRPTSCWSSGRTAACTRASRSPTSSASTRRDLRGAGFFGYVHKDDRALVKEVTTNGGTVRSSSA